MPSEKKKKKKKNITGKTVKKTKHIDTHTQLTQKLVLIMKSITLEMHATS